MSKSDERNIGVSRRRFLRRAVAGAGATAAALGANVVPGLAAAETTPAAAGITIPPEFAAAKTATLPKLEFPMSGAQVFARVCKDEGVAALFCCPGNYTVIHAIASTGIPCLRRAPRRLDGERGGRLHPLHGGDRRVLGHRGSRLHQHDQRHRRGQRRAHAAAVPGEQHGDRERGHGSPHSARLPAAGHRRLQEVRQAADQPRTRARIRRLRIPDPEERRAEARAPRLSRRGRDGEVQGRERARVLLRQSEIPLGLARRIRLRRTSPKRST